MERRDRFAASGWTAGGWVPVIRADGTAVAITKIVARRTRVAILERATNAIGTIEAVFTVARLAGAVGAGRRRGVTSSGRISLADQTAGASAVIAAVALIFSKAAFTPVGAAGINAAGAGAIRRAHLYGPILRPGTGVYHTATGDAVIVGVTGEASRTTAAAAIGAGFSVVLGAVVVAATGTYPGTGPVRLTSYPSPRRAPAVLAAGA